jgi:putative tricarboxylic transport membrane protein
MRLPDRFTGLFLIGLGALAAYGGSRLPPVPGQPVGPNVFPIVVGVGLCLCGLMIAFGIGHRFEEEAEADLAAHTTHSPEEDKPRHLLWYLRALIPPALLLFYVFVVDRIGFIPTAATMVLVTALTLGASLRLAVPLALLAPVGVHLVFYKLLRVPLPEGLLPMPW